MLLCSSEAVTITTAVMVVLTILAVDPFVPKFRQAASQFWVREQGTLMFLGPLVVVTALVMTPLYSSRYLYEEADGSVMTGGSTWADLPIHLHFANAFLYGRNRAVYFHGMHSPIFAGELMQYPFLPDFHAAFLVKAGATMRSAMWLPGILLFVSCVALLFLLTRRVVGGLRQKFANIEGVLAVCFVLFAGGFAGIALLMDKGYEPIVNSTLDPIQDHPDKRNVVWFGFISHVMLPQRGATFAYPLVIFILLLIWVAVSQSAVASSVLPRGDYIRMMITAGVLAGSLPLIQVRSCSCSSVPVVVLWRRCVGSLSLSLSLSLSSLRVFTIDHVLFMHAASQSHALIGLAFFVVAMFFLEMWRAVRVAWTPVKRFVLDAETLTSAEATTVKSSGGTVLAWMLSGVVCLAGASCHLSRFTCHVSHATCCILLVACHVPARVPCTVSLVLLLVRAWAAAEALPQVNLFREHATPEKGFMVPTTLFKEHGFVKHWWTALSATVFVFFASGVLVFLAVRAAWAEPRPASARNDPAGKDKESVVDRLELRALREQQVASAPGVVSPPSVLVTCSRHRRRPVIVVVVGVVDAVVVVIVFVVVVVFDVITNDLTPSRL